MNSFWRGRIQNLDKEMEAYGLLSLSAENVDVSVNSGIPTMRGEFIIILHDFYVY